MAQYLCTVKSCFTIPGRAFIPKPEVGPTCNQAYVEFDYIHKHTHTHTSTHMDIKHTCTIHLLATLQHNHSNRLISSPVLSPSPLFLVFPLPSRDSLQGAPTAWLHQTTALNQCFFRSVFAVVTSSLGVMMPVGYLRCGAITLCVNERPVPFWVLSALWVLVSLLSPWPC